MTPDEYLDAMLTLPSLFTPAVSPDGRWVAWTWYSAAPPPMSMSRRPMAPRPPIRLTDTPDDTSCRLVDAR